MKTLWIRTRTALENLGSGSKDNLLKETCTPGKGEPGPVSVPVTVSGSSGNRNAPSQSETIPDSFMPVRICPHCGYEIRTWILGDLSCTRCENDIRPGEGMGSTLYFRASDIPRDASFRV
jgi:hypothetical protein